MWGKVVKNGQPPGSQLRTLLIRDAVPEDHGVVLAMNNAAVPHVNALSEVEFAWLAGRAEYFRVAETRDDPAGISGFVLALGSGLDYWSDNYRWFGARRERFLYLDRVVVVERARRSGVGRALYADIAAFARGTWPTIALEVNLRPPNPTSIAFHEAMGYLRVGVREYDEKEHAVVMLERPTGPSSPARDTGGPS